MHFLQAHDIGDEMRTDSNFLGFIRNDGETSEEKSNRRGISNFMPFLHDYQNAAL